MATRKKLPAEAKDAAAQESAPAVSFEESMTRLSSIVSDLESGELSLEDSLKRFEEGIRLARSAQSRLDKAEARVEELLGFDDDGQPITEDLDDE